MSTTRLTFCGLVAALFAACGSTALTYTCDPGCPQGTHCTETGCVADSAVLDMAVAAGDLTTALCQPDCAGATPYCNESHVCVPCLTDSHCPGGMVCKQSGAISVCVAGCSNDQGCSGLGASMKCCDGECTDSATDPANCGGCGQPCAPAHAQAVCSGGACSPGPCLPGWGDCNHDPGDGCETNLSLDPASCGACGATCDFTNAVSACSNSCYIAACKFGWDDCDSDSSNGCETAVLGDLKNCGGCGVSCPVPPHAVSKCENAACQLASCAPGFSDCDGNLLNGCEVVSSRDVANCGQCGNVCGQAQVCVNGGCTCKQCNIPNAKTKCVNLQCVFAGCADGFGDCNNDLKDGCEVDFSGDANHCGDCNTVCQKGMSCVGGACVPCGNDCWGAQGCLTGAGHCIQFTCRAGSAGAAFCNGCNGWLEITYDQWMNQGYCADVVAAYRLNNQAQTKCGQGIAGCCQSSQACQGSDNAWHIWDFNRNANYVVGPALGNINDNNCRTWDTPDNSNYTRITACQLF